MFQKYYRPENPAEALAILAEYGGRARVLAGGTDLMVQLERGELSFEAAVDITAIKELRYIREEDDRIKIGALSTHTDLADSPLLRLKAPFLSDAARSVGSLQIRNVGTVGGNLVNAQPAADAAVPLLALDAVVTVVSPEGARQIPLDELYLTQGGTMLNPGRELLTGFSFCPPCDRGGGGAFARVARRKALSLPVFNVAVVLIPHPDANGAISNARIVMGPVARIPFRARDGERVLLSNLPGESTFLEAAEAASCEASPRDSVFRGSGAYRKKLAAIIVYRALTLAWQSMLS